MIGLFVLAGWVIVGIIVAAVDRSARDERDLDETTGTIVSVAGAIVGAAIGQVLRLYVFGEPLGFVFSAAGAFFMLRMYRTRNAERGQQQSAPPPTDRQSSPDTFGTVMGCAALSAFAVAIGGFCGLMFGDAMYPQRYQQFPPVLFFVPLGLVAGFIVGPIVRLSRPQWGIVQIAAVLALAYAGMMFEYAKANVGSVHLELAFDPDPATAVACDNGCSQSTPPLEWTVRGTLHMKETSGLGATIEWIEITSYPDWEPYRGQDLAKRIQENIRGPNVNLSGEHVTGPRRIRPNQDVSYPLQYSYRTNNGASRRMISVQIGFNDGVGRWTTTSAQWNVR